MTGLRWQNHWLVDGRTGPAVAVRGHMLVAASRIAKGEACPGLVAASPRCYPRGVAAVSMELQSLVDRQDSGKKAKRVA